MLSFLDKSLPGIHIMAIAIIVAGGPQNSSRMGTRENKCFLPLQKVPLIVHTLAAFHEHPSITRIFIIITIRESEKIRNVLREYQIKKTEIYPASDTRMQSINNVLNENVFLPEELILIHDGARPFISKELIDKLLGTMQEKDVDAAVVGVKPKDTILLAKNRILKSVLKREDLVSIQTPIIATHAKLIKARELAKEKGYLDASGFEDSALMYKAGMNVKIVPSSYENIKITTPEDLFSGECILQNRSGK